MSTIRRGCGPRLGPSRVVGARASRCAPSPANREKPTRVYLFGKLRVERGGRPLADLSCTSAGDLLAYLVLHRERAVRREAVAQSLWGEGSSSDPKKKLRQALWRLNSILGAAWAAPCGAGEDSIQLSADGTVWADVIALEAAWCEVETRATASAASWDRARAALDLYRGDLLESSPFEWCLFERERLRDLFLATADAVMERCIATSEIAEAIRVGFEILRHDPAREKTHRSLMRLQALRGDRSTALRQYDRCVAALRRELGIAPGQATRDLAERIRSDAVGSAEAAPGDEMAGLLNRLTELRQILSHARREVHLEIEAIQRARHDSSQATPGETRAETRER